MSDLNIFDKVRILIYRYHEKGLEIFLLNDQKENVHQYILPASPVIPTIANSITLEPVSDGNGHQIKSIAFQGDYHDIPSIRGLIKSDITLLKDKLNEVLPDLENGTFVAAKEIFKKILPHEYAAVKELKDILTDRNLLINM